MGDKGRKMKIKTNIIKFIDVSLMILSIYALIYWGWGYALLIIGLYSAIRVYLSKEQVVQLMEYTETLLLGKPQTKTYWKKNDLNNQWKETWKDKNVRISLFYLFLTIIGSIIVLSLVAFALIKLIGVFM
jgi:hypothetical protein